MKKLLSLVLICLLAIPAFACAQVVESSSAGFGGEVKVALTIEEGKIVDAQVTGDSETPGIGAAALEPLAARGLIEQTEAGFLPTPRGLFAAQNGQMKLEG